MTQTPPKRMLLTEVPNYIRTRHGKTVSRRTIFNWADIGRRGEKLRCNTVPDPHHTYGRDQTRMTTTAWVDEFLRRLSD